MTAWPRPPPSLVCLLVTNMFTHSPPAAFFRRPMCRSLFVSGFFFSVADPMTSPRWAARRDWNGRGGGWGPRPTEKQRSPRKQRSSKTKHFLWTRIYLLAGLPEEPQKARWLFNRNQGEQAGARAKVFMRNVPRLRTSERAAARQILNKQHRRN